MSFRTKNRTLKKYVGTEEIVVIPDYIKTIGEYAFEDCDKVREIIIPDSVTTLEERAFFGCDELRRVSIPDTISEIPDYCFYGCRNLVSVSMPDSLISIGKGAFSGCRRLSVTIPKSVKSIGERAFFNCDALADSNGFIVINHQLFGCQENTDELWIPNSVEEIRNGSLDISKYKIINFPDSIKVIEDNSYLGEKLLSNIPSRLFYHDQKNAFTLLKLMETDSWKGQLTPKVLAEILLFQSSADLLRRANELIKDPNEILLKMIEIINEDDLGSDKAVLYDAALSFCTEHIIKAEIPHHSGIDALYLAAERDGNNEIKNRILPYVSNETIMAGNNEQQPSSASKEIDSIFDAIKVLPIAHQRSIELRLKGMPYDEIGSELGCSRQYVFQLVKRGISAVFNGARGIDPIKRVREDECRELFQRYQISLEEWNRYIKRPEYEYRYLVMRYPKGDKPFPAIKDHLNDDNVIEANPGINVPEASTKTRAGTIDDLLSYYRILPQDMRDIVLYSDEEQYLKDILRLSRRVNREIKRKKYISDIRVTESEYSLLRDYLHYAIIMLNRKGIVADEALFATAITNVAIKTYKDGNLWGNFFKETGLKQNPNHQKNIGTCFYDILEKFDLIRVSSTEYVQNILLHCFVSDNYANKYFDFLFDFYRIDLERDISRLDTVTMREFMDSICSEENVGRTYMLVQHIGQAMSANRKGATTRVRNHLKLLDKLFWDADLSVRTTHRLYGLMQKWAKSSTDVIRDIDAYSTGRRRGARRFSQPYIRYSIVDRAFAIVIPPQSIKKYESEEIYWRISGGIDKELPIEQIESVIGYKVLESKTPIPTETVLNGFQLELKTKEDETIKKFYIKKAEIRFFDDEGYPINSKTIKTGNVMAVTPSGEIVRSSAWIDSEERDGLLFSYFSFEYEDVLHMPDGHVVIVGKPDIINSIAGKGRIDGVSCLLNGLEYDLYGRMPYLVLRMPASKYAGTAVTLNGSKNKLSEMDHERFVIDDTTEDVGFYIDLSSYFSDAAGLCSIEVDIPGGAHLSWEYVYIKDFSIRFDEAPYVFVPRGTIVFPDHIVIKDIGENCEKQIGINGFKFVIKDVGRYLNVSAQAGDKDVILKIKVPALFYKDLNGEWDSSYPTPIWHSDLPDVIDISVPYHKIVLYADDTDNDGRIREKEYRKINGSDHMECDISWFKSYLFGDSLRRDLKMKFGDLEGQSLFSVMLHSVVVSLQLLGNYEENEMTVNAVILGKADYCIDVRKGEELIAAKVRLEEGTAVIHHEIGNGLYTVEVFEAETDESGFGEEEYYSIGEFSERMINPYDMTDRSFNIIQIERKGDGNKVLPLSPKYLVFDLQKTEDKHVYNGTLVARKSFYPESAIAAFPVLVRFDDLTKPNYAWISFVDEYGDDADFLYDTKKNGILQEENSRLKPLICYVRYTLLDDDEYVFHIDFSDEQYLEIYDDLPEMIEFPEINNTPVFKV